MLPYRQIHLDFHTSPHIPHVGSQFDPEVFADTMKKAYVDSVTLFARCHHGYLYYDSKLFPERIHPNLQRKNMLKEQVDALHKRDIRTPIYITVQWDKLVATEHPEWLSYDEKGHLIGGGIFDAGFYDMLCVNSPYRDYLVKQTREVLELFDPVDGIFFDITYYHDCCCKYCIEKMKEQGIDIADSKARMDYARGMLDDFKREMKSLVKNYNQEASVYFNTSHISTRERNSLDTCTHLELESLPSGDYGYLHFPMTMRYARQLGLECVGMNGKFHTEWADFHSFKNQAALEFEYFNIAALGGKMICGDQMHPSGALCPYTYEQIGKVYKQIQAIEPYLVDAKPLVEIGVFNADEFSGSSRSKLPLSMRGITRMLQELCYQFNIVDSKSDLSPYKLLILPDEIEVDRELADKLRAYVQSGGRMILTYQSGLSPDKSSSFIEDLLGFHYKGLLPYSPDFIYPEGAIGEGLNRTEYVMYNQGMEIEVQEAQVLAYNRTPYFNRTWEHFCSHRHTPSSGRKGSPVIVQHKNVLYFSHPISTQYEETGTLWAKKLLKNALSLLLPVPMIKHSGPSSLLLTANRQTREKRDVLHLLHYIPERRCQKLDIIEDVIPLYNLSLEYSVEKKVKAIHLADGTPLTYNISNDTVHIHVPELRGHELVIVAYE